MKTRTQNVAIGIQQRLRSSRFPYKATKLIDGVSITQMVIDQCSKSMRYINRHSHKHGIHASIHLLIPEDDADVMKTVIEPVDTILGPEQDVLTRYQKLNEKVKPDYIVRVTGDCPLIPAPIITKIIITAINGEYDFVSNAAPDFRTFYDGADCEIMSSKLLDWVNMKAKGKDREHVTQLLYREKPHWCNYAHVFSELDLTDMKLSVDTEEDYERVKKAYESVENKITKWIKAHGKHRCHRY